MAFINMRFPEDISVEASGGPGFVTDVVITDSGTEVRNQNWATERWEGDCSHAARLPSVWRPLQAFFRIAAGRANTWRYKDWQDFRVSSSDGVFINIDATHAYLAKRYTFSPSTFDRKITKPVSGTVAFTGGSGLSLDYSTGILTYASLPTNWSGEFDLHCRFDTDAMRAETINRQANGDPIVGWQSIPIVEVKE